MISIEEIKRRLWSGANELRGSMDASRYKDYMLGLMFYKFLSDKTLDAFKKMTGIKDASERELVSAYVDAKAQMGEKLENTLKKTLGYFVAPEYLYQSWIYDIDEGHFELQNVTDGLNAFERTIAVTEGKNEFIGLFANSNMDLTDTALGASLNDRSTNIKELLQLFADLNMVDLQKNDVLGDAYEYLIGMFAMESGKKAGEFYTPRQVSEILAQTVTATADISSIYDPCVGSGSLLLTVRKHLPLEKQRILEYFGQEKNTSTYNLTRMNLLLHGVKPDKMTVRNGDTLATDWPEDPKNPDKAVQFDAVVMNPPYSLSSWNKAGLKVNEPRFESYGCLPPDSKGDYAFLLHGLYHLETNGTMSIVLPHGVLFRGGTEGDIRRKLIEKNRIDTVIGLPAGMFTNTGIPVIVMVLKKNRNNSEPVLIIDASKSFVKDGKQNRLQEKDIAKVIDIYKTRAEVQGYSHNATLEELKANDYNLNIPRYVSSDAEEFPHDVDAHLYGGIPVRDLVALDTLNTLCKKEIEQYTKHIREGYVELTADIATVEKDILSCDAVKGMVAEIKDSAKKYAEKYMKLLRNISSVDEIKLVKEEMHREIMCILEEYEFIDEYDGYQLVANTWNHCLTHDTEFIAAEGFYNVGRMREARMVMRGTGKNKHEEQDGWDGVIVPNGLVKLMLFAAEVSNIKAELMAMAEGEEHLTSLAEAAMEEDSMENEALYECLKKNAEDEVQPLFDAKAVKAAIKVAEKGSVKHELLLKVDKYIASVAACGKKAKELEVKLEKAVEERLVMLTDEEIDMIMYEKWFSAFMDSIELLVTTKIKGEVKLLKILNDRYGTTMFGLDAEINSLMEEFERMQSEMVVM